MNPVGRRSPAPLSRYSYVNKFSSHAPYGVFPGKRGEIMGYGTREWTMERIAAALNVT